MKGVWYEAVGGLGLGTENHRCLGYIQKTRRGFEVRLERYEETRTDATERTLEEAKATLVRLAGVTEVAAE